MYLFNILSSIWKSLRPPWRKSQTIATDRSSVVLPPRVYVQDCDLRARWLSLLSKLGAIHAERFASQAATTSASMEMTRDAATPVSMQRADRIDARNMADWMRYRAAGIPWPRLAENDYKALEFLDG